ncbi:MAG: serine/threonine protein kinase, partial [Peptidiphaga gingivicola]
MNIGGYRLIKRIGAGGMSTVFEAEDGAGVRVALKLLHPALVVDHSGRERLRREVAMLQKVRGRYVAEVLDAETDSDEAFIVTELIDGPTLEQDVVDSGVFEGEDLVELAEHLRQAVEAIHEAGVLHRDLKPSNVMLGPDGPVLIDFGIAQVDEDSRLTVPGSVAHTPGYCDPRVINGANPDESADWWALAAVLAFAATGRAPFGKGNPQAIMRRVFEGVPDIVGIQGPVAAAFVRALAPDIEDRIGIDELVEVLKTGRFDDDSSAPHAAFAGIAGVMGGVGSLAAADSAMGEGDTFEPLVTGETAARGVGDTASRNAPGATPQGATEVLGQHPGRPDGAAEALRASGAFGNGAGSEEYGDADYG